MCTRAPLCTPVHPCTVQVALHDLAQVVPLPSGAHNQILRKIPSQGLKLRFAYPPLLVNPSIVHCLFQNSDRKKIPKIKFSKMEFVREEFRKKY